MALLYGVGFIKRQILLPLDQRAAELIDTIVRHAFARNFIHLDGQRLQLGPQ